MKNLLYPLASLAFFSCCIFSSSALHAQTPASPNIGEIHGNFEMDMQYYKADSVIKAPAVPEKTLMNGFLNLIYTRDNFTAGLRYEAYLGALQGYDPRYKGTGILYRFATYKTDQLEVTVGSFYEQFGSGLVLRTYEDRGLGFDNALDGLRFKMTPHKGIHIKGVYGLQRSFMTYGPGTVRGIDGEIVFNELFEKLANKKTSVILGASFVSKFQADNGTGTYVVPQNVGAWSERLNIHRGKVTLMAEYAYKINDPSFTNNYNYRPGQALFITGSYSQKGLGISLSGIRTDNMDYRSDRTASVNNLLINYLPCLTKQQTYSMLNFYPYATQALGEIGYQAEVTYKIKKGTLLGGNYGTLVIGNFSTFYGLDSTKLNPANDSARMGYKVNKFFGASDRYFEDFNVEIDHKFTQHFKAIAMYASQVYDKAIIQGEPGEHTIYSQIGVMDLIYKINDTFAIRMEMEHLYTKQDQGSWASALLEFTIAPKYFVALSDQWNYRSFTPAAPGQENYFNKELVGARGIHYFNINAGYIHKTTRYQIGYGKQRSGIFCVGGVCRYVPASNGITFSVITNF
ncbi:MAG: DUF6029 family protein [Bacteroidia bacterium]